MHIVARHFVVGAHGTVSDIFLQHGKIDPRFPNVMRGPSILFCKRLSIFPQNGSKASSDLCSGTLGHWLVTEVGMASGIHVECPLGLNRLIGDVPLGEFG